VHSTNCPGQAGLSFWPPVIFVVRADTHQAGANRGEGSNYGCGWGIKRVEEEEEEEGGKH
jgi:hypothetical protein